MWVTARREIVPYNGEQLSTPAFAPDFVAPKSPWMPALVPGTVLATLVANGAAPDPNIGLDSLAVPDIGKTGPEAYTHWFCVQIDCKMADVAVPLNKLSWLLEFDGINYSFDLFLNGSPLPVEGNRGMFLQHRIDLGQRICDGPNILAVLVHPPDHFGRIEGGGQGGDHALAQDVASQFFEGWDWIIPVADRGTGIWGDVRLRPTGCIRLADPYAVTHVPPETVAALKANVSQIQSAVSAEVSSSVSVTNVSTTVQSVTLTLHIEHSDGGVVVVDIVVSETISVPAQTSLQHSFALQKLTNALLWWPIDMGDQPLYTMSVEATQPYLSDYCESTFGVRHLESYLDAGRIRGEFELRDPSSASGHDTAAGAGTGGRIFAVNGQKVFVRGANYICSDMLLRQPAARVWHEVRLHAQARLNMLRCWGGAGCQPRALYDACDALGILVWVEFWITGVTCAGVRGCAQL